MAEPNLVDSPELSSLPPAPPRRSNNTVIYIVAAIVVLCCGCFGSLGLIIAFFPSILSELGLG